MRTLLFTVLFSCLSILGFGQAPGLVTGNIVDKNQQLSLPGATLKLKPGNHYTVSNQQGKFEFLSVPAGTYTLEVTYIGYQTFTQEVTVAPGKATDLKLKMEAGGVAGKEVLVIGDRLRGQAKALNQQRNNPNITNIVSADQIGRFPDANVGDAIKRIPGITMQNDQGEARNIIIRGLAPELNSVSLNGDRIPSAEGDNRRVQMDLIPSDMVQTIEVNKTLTPDMDADAIGGSVNLVTRAAPNGPRVSATLSGGVNPIRNKALYTGSLVLANRFFDSKLGAVLSASYNNNDYGSDDMEATWSKDDFGHIYTSESEVRKYNVQRIRRSASAALDYKINAKNTLYANAMYNWRDDRENRYRLRITDIEPEYDDNDAITGYVGSVRRETKGGIDNSRNKSRRLEDQRVQNYSLRGEHLLGSKVDLDWSASFSTASEDRPHERYIEYRADDGPVSLDLSDTRVPLVTASSLTDQDFGFKSLSENHDYTRENELGLKLNLRFPFSVIPGQKGRLRVGGRLRLKDKERVNNFFEYEPITEFGNLAEISNIKISGKGYQPGEKYTPGTFVINTFLGGQQLDDATKFEKSDNPAEYLAVNFNAKERITAGYIRWDQDLTKQLSVIAGVRIENTHIDYEGNIVAEEEDLEGTRKVKNSYTNVLPGITFKYNVNNDLVLRAAVTTSIARPNYYDIAPYVSSVADDAELSAGNPDLKAARALNFDLMAEQYFKSVGILSGGVFYKSISDFIYTYRDNAYTMEKFAADYKDVATNPIPAGEKWTYKQARNGDNVKVYGFEVALQRQLDFLPGFLKGFGVYVNYTYTKSKADGIYNADGDKRTDVTLPGTAPHMFNASLSYESSRFTARLSGNYTASYLDELGGDDFDDRFYDKQFFLDLNASFKLTKQLRVFGEANNLTNQPLRYYQGISSRTMQAEYYRPRYNFGLKFDL
ncbi:TonB-dependent receptor [Chitinophaga sp. CF418]|uniref:TonB-dependent receptor n=1 Tax=Chitinophaga sp. CF418 TaxID=1855287 RepID=UPI000917EF92|nr:TonB-dependent receptor [Chitinophaga sp. CF418]SHN44770.1 TonB-dependent receptor [Chitinophaga sp. CF418]